MEKVISAVPVLILLQACPAPGHELHKFETDPN